MQIQAARRWPRLLQGPGQQRHAFDDLLLAGAEGVALALGLVLKIRRHLVNLGRGRLGE
jgi:hypothetical protein